MANIDVDGLVAREVIYCVSMLISTLVKDEKYSEELMQIIVRDDWEDAALDDFLNTDEHFTRNDFLSIYGSDFRAYCDEREIDPQQVEAYEHWIVSSWLADKLEAEGEMILRDFLGMTIWGRATTGQAIAMDYVIEKIHADLIK